MLGTCLGSRLIAFLRLLFNQTSLLEKLKAQIIERFCVGASLPNKAVSELGSNNTGLRFLVPRKLNLISRVKLVK